MRKGLGLIADIGATNARFALADGAGFHEEKNLKCGDFPGLVEAARYYLKQVSPSESPEAAAFAVAGPVKGDRFEMTNHPWSFSIGETQAALALKDMRLINDFKAIAMAIPHLTSKDWRQIGNGAPVPEAPIGVIGPGTGLGVASLVWCGQKYVPVPGEGGHVTMPARTQREFDIFRTLKYKYTHLSAERVCSGKGLVNIYNALRILDGHENLPDRTPEEISELALSGSCKVCVETLDKMMGFLGTIAGNLALTLGAFGGIYIAGGIPMKLGEYVMKSRFREEFLSKGRFATYLDPIPTYVICNPYVAFIGLHAEIMGD